MSFHFLTKHRACIGGCLCSLALLISAFAAHVNAICSDSNSPLTALMAAGDDDGKRIPLILIHGKGGTRSDAKVDADDQTWPEFVRVFGQPANGLSSRYSLYFFQYCSDRASVGVLASELRDLIDAKLTDRPHVIFAHSLGGLIAKSYMAQAEHKQGNWKGKKGGDTTFELITLATPHHGTPGANDPATFRQMVPDKYRSAFEALQNVYWLSKHSNDLVVLPPDSANRSDLRWDNYDGKIVPGSKDINVDLARTNTDFEPYLPKLISYGGIADAKLTPLEMAAMLIESQFVDDDGIRRHRMLTFANMGLVWGLGRHFGEADGLVPYVSALDCRSKPSGHNKSSSYVCESASRVRRFESGSKAGEASASELPDKNTLSIFRSPGGFDHLDMLTSPDVFRYVVKDLAAIADPTTVKRTERSAASR